MTFDGIGGTMSAIHYGCIIYETFDSHGNLIKLEHDIFYVPGIECRLFSPQYFAHWTQSHEGGEKRALESVITPGTMPKVTYPNLQMCQ